MKHLFKYPIVFLFMTTVVSCSSSLLYYGKTYELENITPSAIRLDINSNVSISKEKIKTLKELQMLDLTGNSKTRILEILENIPDPKKIKILILDSIPNLETLPSQLLKCKTLKHISLNKNPNLDLKATLEILKNLPIEFLNLQENQIQSLPKNLEKMLSLKDLNLSKNHIKDGNNYTTLGKIPKLYSLWLSENQLKKLPKEIGKLSQINYLYLNHNSLQNLPPQIKEMKKMRVLHLEYNEFDFFPEVFSTLPSLLLLHINNNNIKRFSKVYEKKKYNFKGLILDNNPILQKERLWAEKEFSNFFLLSFEQN